MWISNILIPVELLQRIQSGVNQNNFLNFNCSKLPEANREAPYYGYANVLWEYQSKGKEITAQRVVVWNWEDPAVKSFPTCGVDSWK